MKIQFKSRANSVPHLVISYSLLFSMLASPLTSMAAPQGGRVAIGDASIIQTGLTTNINQTSQHATLDWTSFNVGNNETVNFNQPNSSSTTLNRIHDQDPSSILGTINANGRVFLANPNGFIFGANSQVNTGAFVAASSEITDFDQDSITFAAAGQGEIINHGDITSSDGFIGFFSPAIENQGKITSDNGHVLLSNDNAGTLYLPNSAGIGFVVDSLESLNPIAIEKSGINNQGQIKASGGQVVLSSSAIDSTLFNAINNDGLIDVSGFEVNGGEIRILASQGSIEQNGQLVADAINHGNGGDIIMIAEQGMIHTGSSSARGGDLSGNGGFIETSGMGDLHLNTDINTRALNGDWGTWLIDPTSIDVGDGTSFTSTFINNGLSNSQQVLFQADTINVTGVISTSASGTLTFDSSQLNIGANINTSAMVFDSAGISVDPNVSLTATNNIDINGVLTSTGQALNITAQTANINANVNAGNLNLNTNTTNLNTAALSTSGELNLQNNSQLNIEGNSEFNIQSTGELNFNGVTIAGVVNDSTAESTLTINSNNGKIDMRNMSMTSNNRLANFTINRVTSDANNESISISGDIYADNFSIINTGTSSAQQNINLSNDTNIITTTSVFDHTVFSNSNGQLAITATESVTLDKVDQISSLTINSPELTLTDDISTQGDGISISGGSILLNKGSTETVNLTTFNTGNLTINSSISSIASPTASNENLAINVADGAINLSNVFDINDLSIANTSNLSNLNGDIDIIGTLSSMSNEITIAGGIAISAGDIDFSLTDIVSTDLTKTNALTANAVEANNSTGLIQLADLDVGSLTVNSTELRLSGQLSSNLAISDSMDLSNAGKITLANDTVITGNLVLHSPGAEESTFDIVTIDSLTADTPRSLEINYTSQDLLLGLIGKSNALQSFTLNGSGEVSLASTSDFSIATSGRDGISFLGDLTLELTENLSIDTSKSSGGGGDINLSGLTLDGEFEVILDSGSANTSLGNIGSTTPVASLTTEGTGNLELYSNIVDITSKFDFSSHSAINLNDNISFGSVDLYLAELLFGDATLNGNYDFTAYASKFSVGTIGQNIALQNLSLNTFDQVLTLSEDVNVANNINLSGGIINLDANITSTGGDIFISALTGIGMGKTASLNTDYSSLTLVSTAGDISIANLNALHAVTISAETGSIRNAIDDYISNTSTSTNITSQQVTLMSGGSIGSSVASPVVINAGSDGNIGLNAGGNIYIANLENSATSDNSNIIDNSAQTATANADILNQLKPELFNITQLTQLEVSNPIWQMDEFHLDNSDSHSSPRIYYSKKGWRLGNPKK